MYFRQLLVKVAAYAIEHRGENDSEIRKQELNQIGGNSNEKSSFDKD